MLLIRIPTRLQEDLLPVYFSACRCTINNMWWHNQYESWKLKVGHLLYKQGKVKPTHDLSSALTTRSSCSLFCLFLEKFYNWSRSNLVIHVEDQTRACSCCLNALFLSLTQVRVSGKTPHIWLLQYYCSVMEVLGFQMHSFKELFSTYNIHSNKETRSLLARL